MNNANNLIEFNKSLIKLSSAAVLTNLKSELDKFLDYLEKQYTIDIDIINSNLLSILSDGYTQLLKIISFCEIYILKEQNETKKYLFEKISQIKVSIKDYLEKFNGIKTKITEIKIKKITEQIKINKELESNTKSSNVKKDNTQIKNDESIETELIDNKNTQLTNENILLQKELYQLNQQHFDDSQYEIVNSYNNLINYYSFIIISYKEIVGKI
jgi:hypothetical protein